MNHSRYHLDPRRSPYPRRRKSLVPRSPELSNSLPAITLLSPDPYHLKQTMTPTPFAPGDYRMVPPRSAKNKMSSFVIINETMNTPVASRAPTPSGRVSPFRGHGFKSPASSRPGSRAMSPLPSPSKRKVAALPTEKAKPVYKDIGLPPKSPKKILKNVKIKEFKPTENVKPAIPPKPRVTTKKPLQRKVKVAKNDKSVVMSTVSTNNDKKSPVPPKTAVEPKPVAAPPPLNSDAPSDEKISEEPESASVEPPNGKEAQKPEEEKPKLIPCYQPDKCCVVPPTMASPLQTATSTVSVPATSSVTPVSRASLGGVTTAVSATSVFKTTADPRDSVTSVRSETDRLLVPGIPTPQELTVTTMTTVDEVIKSRPPSAISRKSGLLSLESPTLSERTRSSMVTVRAASNGSLKSNGQKNASAVSSAVVSTTKLIRADPDVEVLSPNNLLTSPPSSGSMRQPLWEDGRSNGVPPNTPKGRCQRFLSALWRLLSFLFCCCKKWTCCKSACCNKTSCTRCCKKSDNRNQVPAPKESCCTRCRRCCSRNPCSFFTKCLSKLNCCKKIKCCSCSCSKVKCCEGRKCCKKTPKTKEGSKTSCCAKPSCSCRDCCAKMKDCCTSCGDGVNRCCRVLFCLNLACCQRCLGKCTCCHKYKCCQKGGCGSCCNPNVKKEQRNRLDKKNSRASNQSKQERAKLDAALVDHSSLMKAAIPVLPSCLAYTCLIMNIGIPGSGTLMSGILCVCFGKPRFSVNDNAQNRMSSLIINIVIAVGQAFTIIFCLVGWGWSIWWGVIMVKLARKQKRLRLAEKNADSGPSNMNHVDVERR